MRRVGASCIVLVAVYVALSLVNDARGTLGTDTGGKVATLRSMHQRATFDPDVGYWAGRWDPDGAVHPLYYTTHVGDRWVNATTFPVLYLAHPLYAAGGYRLTLLIPMLGSLGAALAARALARRLGSPGTLAFWVIGLASPATIYAIDFWEHSVGLALMAWAVVVLVDGVLRRRRDWASGLAAGLLFGAAVTVRTEALVYVAVATAVACVLVLLAERRLLPPIVLGGMAVVGLALPIAANTALERATVGDAVRTERASGAAESGGDTASLRLEEGLVTGVGLQPTVSWDAAGIGGAAAALLVYAGRRSRRPGDAGPGAVAAAGAGAIYAVRMAQGLGFVPGMTAASPISTAAAAGPGAGAPRRMLVLVALVALPVVWAFQFRGGAPAQWGGRYLLLSGLILTVLGVVALEQMARPVRIAAVALSGAVTLFGIVWVWDRTHDVARTERALDRRPEAVLISRVAHLAREGGAFYTYGGEPWLTAVTDAQERRAVDVVRRAGRPSFAVIDTGRGRVRRYGGFTPAGTDHLDFLGLKLRIVSYRRVR